MILKRNIFNPVFLKCSRKKSYRFEKNFDRVTRLNPSKLWILSSEDDQKALERIEIKSAIRIAVRELLLAPQWEGCASTLAKATFPANQDM